MSPKSDTFGNAKASAIKAGYKDEYADQITSASWFIGKLRRLNMLDKAERTLEKTLGYDPIDPVTKVMKTDLLRIQTDVAKHLTKTLGKEDYSERIETTGKDGNPLIPEPSEGIRQLANKLLDEQRPKLQQPTD